MSHHHRFKRGDPVTIVSGRYKGYPATQQVGTHIQVTNSQGDNLKGLARMNAQWVEDAMAHTPHQQ